MCTLEKYGNIFVLTLTGEGEHRLSPSLIDSIRSALSQVKSHAAAGSYALITMAHGNFFSNGFDIDWDGSDAGLYNQLDFQMKPLVADLLSLPMPTIAAVTGHAVAAGFILAISHDYVLMTKDKGVLYMSEIDIGMSPPEHFTVMFGEKLPSAAARRDVLLRADKVRAEEAVAMGIVDSAHGSTGETVEAALILAEELAGRRWSGEVYGETRKSLYPETCRQFGVISRRRGCPPGAVVIIFASLSLCLVMILFTVFFERV